MSKFGSIFFEMIKNVFRRPVTSNYPFEQAKPTPGYRGIPIFDISKCTGCGLCAKDCPSFAIEMVPDERTKRKIRPKIDYCMCIRCGQCADSCRYGALTMSQIVESAVYPTQLRHCTSDIYMKESE